MRMATPIPTKKVVASSIGAAVAQLIIILITVFFPEKPGLENIQAPLTVILTFAFGYITPPAARDTLAS